MRSPATNVICFFVHYFMYDITAIVVKQNSIQFHISINIEITLEFTLEVTLRFPLKYTLISTLEITLKITPTVKNLRNLH